MTFREDLESVIEQHKESNPVLADYMQDCLDTFDREQRLRKEIRSEDENL